MADSVSPPPAISMRSDIRSYFKLFFFPTPRASAAIFPAPRALDQMIKWSMEMQLKVGSECLGTQDEESDAQKGAAHNPHSEEAT
mmetsp:Transcript_3096/g.4481  ORF Transcript_3096/g.4481 Transcript_3096/m.4481 type:complete len:85 (+) Transcript_3096:3-257(+)